MQQDSNLLRIRPNIMVSVVKYTDGSEACKNAFKYFMEDCTAHPNPYIAPTDIILGKDWLSETGPNFVAHDEHNQPLGFLAIGWKFSAEKLSTEFLVVKEAKILSNDGVAKVSVQDGYNIFMYIASSARRRGVGELLLAKINDIMDHGEYQQLRYTAVLDNEGSRALIEKYLRKTPDLVADAYSHITEDCNVITYIISKNAEQE